MSSVTITSGRAIIYRMFDIAEDIELTRIGGDASRLTIPRGGSQIVVRDAPVTIAMSPSMIRLGTQPIKADTSARACSHFLEIIIIVLILYEILSAALG